jgi:chromosome segregation ATPase
VLEKLFGSGQSANTPVRDEDPTLKSEKIARTFDSIGLRNEALRAELVSIEFSFRDIEAIRTQLYDALSSIAEILEEIEHTKFAQVEAERKLEELTAAHERLEMDKAELRVERDALAVVKGELSARVADLERVVTTGEAARSEARATLIERSAKLEHVERELEDNRRAQDALTEQLQATRAEFVNRENRLLEVERQRGALNDHCDLLARENDELGTKVEEFHVMTSKLGRELSELKDQRDELKRLLREAETSFGQETAALAQLKAARLDAMEAQRLNETNLQVKLAATTSRLNAAEQLLMEAGAEMHEQDAAIRESEHRVFQNSLEAKSLEAQIVDLEKDLASARAAHVDAEVARTAATEQSVALASSLKDNEVALRRAEQKTATVEAGFEDYRKASFDERALFEEKIARLTEQLEAQSAARLVAESALQSARQERAARRREAHDDPAESLSGEMKSEHSNIPWLRH